MTYRYHPFPAISKSTLNTYDFCKFLFWNRYILGVQTESSVKADLGTYLHDTFDKFYDVIDFDVLWKLKWQRVKEDGTKRKRNEVEAYLYMEDIFWECFPDPDDAKGQDWLERHAIAFASFNYDYLCYLRNEFSDKKRVKWYFLPKKEDREKTLYDKDRRMFGSYDRILKDFKKNADGYEDVICILDYKSGHIPKGVMEGRQTKGGYAKGLASRHRRSGTFYCMLYLKLNHGIGLKKFPDGKGNERYYFCNKEGKQIPTPNMEYGYLFTSGNKDKPYYIAKKSLNILSARSVLRKIKEIRDSVKIIRDVKGNIVDYEKKAPFPRTDNIFTCQRCGAYKDLCSDPGVLSFEIL